MEVRKLLSKQHRLTGGNMTIASMRICDRRITTVTGC